MLWEEINIFIKNHGNESILTGGDFNTIINLDEKFGGIQQSSQASLEFKKWIDINNLINIPINNGKYTWNNRRKDFAFIAEKLDRFLFKGELSGFDLDLQVAILPTKSSDHFPIRIEFSEPIKPVRNPFKCEKCGF